MISLFVHHPLQATEQDVWDMFSQVGEVLEVGVLKNSARDGGQPRSKGCAFVTYANRMIAQVRRGRIVWNLYSCRQPRLCLAACLNL